MPWLRVRAITLHSQLLCTAPHYSGYTELIPARQPAGGIRGSARSVACKLATRGSLQTRRPRPAAAGRRLPCGSSRASAKSKSRRSSSALHSKTAPDVEREPRAQPATCDKLYERLRVAVLPERGDRGGALDGQVLKVVEVLDGFDEARYTTAEAELARREGRPPRSGHHDAAILHHCAEATQVPEKAMQNARKGGVPR